MSPFRLTSIYNVTQATKLACWGRQGEFKCCHSTALLLSLSWDGNAQQGRKGSSFGITALKWNIAHITLLMPKGYYWRLLGEQFGTGCSALKKAKETALSFRYCHVWHQLHQIHSSDKAAASSRLWSLSLKSLFLGLSQEIILKHSTTHLPRSRTVGFNCKMDFYIASDLSSNWGLKKKKKRKSYTSFQLLKSIKLRL